jgi:hypothetical protein
LTVKILNGSVTVSSATLAGNVLQIVDGRAFQHKSLFGELNFRLPQNCQAEHKTPPIANVLLAAVVLPSILVFFLLLLLL